MSLRHFKYLTLFNIIVLSIGFSSCEKEVELIIPPAENKIVVDGYIENGQPPIILLSQTRDYNEVLDANSFNDFYLGGATVVVTHNGIRDTLTEICTADLPDELIESVAELTGLNATLLSEVNLCGYTDLGGTLIGTAGTSYGLEIDLNGSRLTSTAKIPEVVTLDSLYFRLAGDDPTDSLGFAYAQLTDPDSVGNAYRWFAKRINTYPEWSEQAGEQKDAQFIAPLGSSYDDSFFNGLNFEFAYYRGALASSGKEDDLNRERGFFKTGDTVAVRGTSIDRNTYLYVVSFEAEAGSAGNPFTAPAPIYTNIEGGIGVWAGYAAAYDTLICLP